jgi:hypothetical protein
MSADKSPPLPAADMSFAVIPASHLWARFLRSGMGLVLLFQALRLWPDVKDIAASHAIVPSSIAELVDPWWLPRVGWFTPLLTHAGLDGQRTFIFIFALYSILLISLILNFLPRATSLLVFVLHLVLAGSTHFSLYGVDRFARIGLFYCVIAPVRVPLLEASDALWRSSLVHRLLQFNLMVAYWTAGIAKSFAVQWWSGEALWQAMAQPIFRGMVDPAFLAAHPRIASMAAISVLVIEICYPLFMLPKATRPIWLALVVLMHLGIGLFMNMWSFAFVMIVLNTSAFGSEYVVWLLSRLSQKLSQRKAMSVA